MTDPMATFPQLEGEDLVDYLKRVGKLKRKFELAYKLSLHAVPRHLELAWDYDLERAETFLAQAGWHWNDEAESWEQQSEM